MSLLHPDLVSVALIKVIRLHVWVVQDGIRSDGRSLHVAAGAMFRSGLERVALSLLGQFCHYLIRSRLRLNLYTTLMKAIHRFC